MMYKFYCDLDGVLANFEKGAEKILGKPFDQCEMGYAWSILAKSDNFFGRLDWMDDGQELWNYIKKYNPTILTGIPFGGWAPRQKREWCTHHLGPEVPVITCWSKEKHLYAADKHILIDDRKKAMKPWENAGGTFILHISAKDSVNQLKKLDL